MQPNNQPPTQNPDNNPTYQQPVTEGPPIIPAQQPVSYAVPENNVTAPIIQTEQPNRRFPKKYFVLAAVVLLVIVVGLGLVYKVQQDTVRGSGSNEKVQSTDKKAATDNIAAESAASPSAATAPAPTTAQSTPKPAPAPVASSKKSAAQTTSSGFTCVSNETYAKQIDPGALKQVESSVKTALAGGSAGLTSWVPKEYSNTSPLNDPAEVDKSFRSLKPSDCKVEFAYSVDATVFSGKATVFSLSYKSNQNKPYVSRINVANVSGVWKTYGISVLEPIN